MLEAPLGLKERPSVLSLVASVLPHDAGGLVDRLPWLLGELRRSAGENTLQHRLVQLLDNLAPLLASRSNASLDAERLASILPDLSIALAQKRRFYGMMNPWTASGAKRREVRNAAILAALWSPAQAGDVAVSFLAEFFARCGARGAQELPALEELALGYRMRVENCPGADGADRVDLVIETAMQLIGIEVKIDAGEGRDQLDRYVATIRRNAGQLDKQARVVFLAPFAPSRDDVVPATWSTVRAAAAAVLPRSRADYNFAHHLVAHFARHARSF